MDVIPKVYEGGLKTWESLFDMIKYFSSDTFTNIVNMYTDYKLVEYGCGTGLFSIFVALFSNLDYKFIISSD